MPDRISALQSLLRNLEVDALWITFLPDIRWACGFTGSNGLLVIVPDGAHFISDGRYATQALGEVTGARTYTESYDLVGQVKENGLMNSCRTACFQSDHLTVAELENLRETFPAIEWQGGKELLVHEVAAKSSDEIARMRRAQRLSENVLTHVLGILRPGLSEKEVAAEIVYRHMSLGAEKMSFDPVVASGPNAALPHARPTERALKHGEAVLLDFGCFLDGYASDMTRTVFLGRAGEEEKKVYSVVLDAQRRAIEAARGGMPSKELDGVARDWIKDAGYGDYYPHGLGHGLGLQIHEWPRVSYTVDYDLPPVCTVTIEPGVYLPGRFGVRIEDTVVLRKDGNEVLTSAPKDLLVL